MLIRARTLDVLLPVLLYPVTIPVIIAGVRGTAALLESPADLAVANLWIAMLAFFDVVFVTLSLWIFEPLMTEGQKAGRAGRRGGQADSRVGHLSGRGA